MGFLKIPKDKKSPAYVVPVEVPCLLLVFSQGPYPSCFYFMICSRTEFHYVELLHFLSVFSNSFLELTLFSDL